MPIDVRLLDHTSDPVRSLYLAYRTAYSSLTPQAIADRIGIEKITRQQMLDFIEKRLETGHASPLVAFKKGEFPYTIPDTVRRAGYAEKMEQAFDRLGELYQEMIDNGVPAEDARFLIPNAANTNFKIVVNFLELLHICDLRLCTRAQWEFRQVASQMRAQIHRKFPELAKYIQPKCGDKRWGYCDESVEDWEACAIGRKRPHKKMLFELFDAHRRGELAPLAESDFKVIEEVGSSVVTPALNTTPPPPRSMTKAPLATEDAPGEPPSTRDEG
jgi:thymidylate synthase (FAD)